tara:strand:+ start:3372 stop:3722 length:351 start_codon:yes stop_codon:yes gene_type:complete
LIRLGITGIACSYTEESLIDATIAVIVFSVTFFSLGDADTVTTSTIAASATGTTLAGSPLAVAVILTTWNTSFVSANEVTKTFIVDKARPSIEIGRVEDTAGLKARKKEGTYQYKQ